MGSDIKCTRYRCEHVLGTTGGRDGHCYTEICGNYYQKCPVHRGK